MEKIALASRFVLGLILVVFGLNGFFNFITPPPPTPEGGAFLGALFSAGYVFPIVKIVEIVVGIMLLAKKYVALGLLLLAPITVNIVAYHAVLDPAGLALPLVVLITHLILAKDNFAAYKEVLKA